MSIRLVKAVLASAIPHHLKVTAAAMAMYANDRGEDIFPAVSTLATETNKPERSIRRDIVELIELGIVEAETERRRGLRRPTHYVMKPEALHLEKSDTGVRSSIGKNGQLRPKRRTPVVGERTAASAETDAHVSRSFKDPSVPLVKVSDGVPPSPRASSEKDESDYRKLYDLAKDLVLSAETVNAVKRRLEALPEACGCSMDVIHAAASAAWTPKALRLPRVRS